MAWPTIISVLVLKCTPVLTKIIDCSCNSNKLHRTECNDENGENPIFQPAAWACNFNLLIQSILKHHGTFIGLTINSSFYVQCKKWPNQNLEFICSNHLKIIIRYEFRCRLKIDCYPFSYGLNQTIYSFRLLWRAFGNGANRNYRKVKIYLAQIPVWLQSISVFHYVITGSKSEMWTSMK